MAQNELAYKGYCGSIDPSIEDECLHGRILFIDDLITYEGDTMPGLRDAFQAAVDRYLAHCEKVGKQPGKPYSGSFNVRKDPSDHALAAKIAHQRGVTLNEFVKRAIKSAIENDGVVRHHHHHQHDLNVHLTADDRMVTGHALASGQMKWKEQKYVN